MDSRENNCNFYKGKKVLVTGHTGFKGSWLCCVLNYLGAKVMGYSLPPETDSLYEQIEGDKIVTSFYGYLEDLDFLRKTIREFCPEIIIHLAAFGFMNECFKDPHRAYSSNVMGTVNLLEVIRECDFVKSVVVVSTDKVYANKDDGSIYSEEDLLGGFSPYSCSKTCMELVVKDYYDNYFKSKEPHIGIAVVRASNVLAGGDHIQSRLIPTILNSIDAGVEVEIRNPNQTRPWQSVLDALDAYLSLGRLLYDNPDEYSEAWNIGPTIEGIKSVGWIFNKMESYFNGLEMKSLNSFEVHESETLGLDISKSLSRLDWYPKLSLDSVLELIVDFYKECKTGEKLKKICDKQINQYYGGNEYEME